MPIITSYDMYGLVSITSMLEKIPRLTITNCFFDEGTQPIYVFWPYPNFPKYFPRLPFRDAERIVPTPHLGNSKGFLVDMDGFGVFEWFGFVSGVGLICLFGWFYRLWWFNRFICGDWGFGIAENQPMGLGKHGKV